jgi:hypothetical protein
VVNIQIAHVFFWIIGADLFALNDVVFSTFTVLQESFHPLFNLGTDIGPALRHFQLIEAQVPWFWEATVFIIGTLLQCAIMLHMLSCVVALLLTFAAASLITIADYHVMTAVQVSNKP